jgi:hypothetical protein
MPLQDYVFNPVGVLTGTAVMLLCLVVQAFAAGVVLRGMRSRIEALNFSGHHLRAQIAFFGGAVVLIASHLLQIFIWGQFLHRGGLISDPHVAMLFAGSTYTTVGFVNDPLPINWQVVVIIMATNGYFSFAWSTTAMIQLSLQLYSSERKS